MRCEDTQSALIDFYYQELETDQHRSISGHLVECHGCAQAYRLLHGDLSAMESEWTELPSTQLGARLRTQAQGMMQPTVWQRSVDALAVRIPAYQAAAAALVIIGVWMGLERNGPAPEPAPLPRHAAVAPAPKASPQAVPVNYDSRNLMAIDHHVL